MTSARRQQAFTLIELLVVLGILVLLSTIGVAAFIGSGKINRLAATEQLISSQIRQARYTARATGQAVLIYLDKNARTISGVSRIPVWQGSCEAPYASPVAAATIDDQPPFDQTNNLDRAKFHIATGRSGTGIGRQSGIAMPSDVAAVTLFDPASATGTSRNRQITRSSTKPTEGFALSCAVRPVRVEAVATTQPLLVIGPDDVTTHPDTTKSFAGILLKATTLKMYNGATPPTIETDTAKLNGNTILGDNNPDRLCWDVLGWVMPEGATTPFIISSITDSVASGTADQKFLVDGDDGGRWEEITMVYTGASLELYRDGIQIAHVDTGVPTRVSGYNQAHRLFIGGAVVNGLAPAKVIDSATVIDDIALFRLGTDQPGQLAPGVDAAQNARLLVRPDGRISDELSPGATTVDLTFTGVFAEKEDKTIISITSGTGLISSKIIPSKSAP